MKKISAIIFLLIVGFLIFYFHKQQTGSTLSSNPTATVSRDKNSVIAKNLKVPWSLVFLPSGDLLFTQRAGEVMVIKKDQNSPKLIGRIDDAKEYGEGGLLGAEISPKFSSNHYIYFYYTYDVKRPLNRVIRYKLENDKLSDPKTIIDAIPGAVFHDGGRIKFGPDGYLYATAGDSLNPSLAQDKSALAGKILRFDEDGNAPSDNPFGNLTYSYGHRNPQGLTWDNTGQLWETEHGPSGVWPDCCQDEINRIEKGKNYGWPDSVGDKVQAGTVAPVLHSGRDTWAPSGMAYLDGNLYFAGLKGEALYKFNILTKTLTPYFKNVYGRLRDVIVGPDGFLYIATNNRDGRGSPKADDDKIIRVDPQALQ